MKRYAILTSESAPLSAPGQVNVTYSWHLLWTTKLHTAHKYRKDDDKGDNPGSWTKDDRAQKMFERIFKPAFFSLLVLNSAVLRAV